MSSPESSARSALTPSLRRRFARTEAFLGASLPAPARLLDLGPPNTLGERLKKRGYAVAFTGTVDLDEHPEAAAAQVAGADADAVTAFEILEHLVNPLGVLRAIQAPRLFATVPMRLWFSSAYRNPRDPWDRHYHEFEDWQFDWLLEKAGWEVVRRERWTNPPPRWTVGVRPLLRRVTPRWYVVEASRGEVEDGAA
ncbi:MAG: methyltransferase domain-containing protein [Bacteroidota bacterium]